MSDRIEEVKSYIESKTPIKVSIADVIYTLTENDGYGGKDKMKEFDALFVFRYGEVSELVVLEFRSYLTPARIGKLGDMLSRSNNTLIVISEYITPDAKSKLRNLGVSFIELNGSIFIKGKAMHVDIRSSKSNRSKLTKRTDRLSKKSLQLLEWLVDNDIWDKTYREISNETGVSQGVISELLKTLVEKKYLIKNSGRQYVKNAELDLTKFYLKNKI